MPPPPLIVATDGSALRNPGPGGWAWVAEDGTSKAGGRREATNNQMELRAVLEALTGIDPTRPLVVQTDSRYVHDIFTKWLEAWRRDGMRTQGGKGPPVLNADLIERIDAARAARAPVAFAWVRGHSGHALNEKADTLAQAAAQHAKRVTTASAPAGDRRWMAEAARAQRELDDAAKRIETGETRGERPQFRRESTSRAGRHLQSR